MPSVERHGQGFATVGQEVQKGHVQQEGSTIRMAGGCCCGGLLYRPQSGLDVADFVGVEKPDGEHVAEIAQDGRPWGWPTQV